MPAPTAADEVSLLYASIEALHDAIEAHSVITLRDRLRAILHEASKLALLHLLLLDGNETITVAIIVPPLSPDYGDEEKFKEGELRLIGQRLRAEVPDAPPSLLELALNKKECLIGEWLRDEQDEGNERVTYWVYDMRPLGENGSLGDSYGEYRFTDSVGFSQIPTLKVNTRGIFVAATRWAATTDLPAMSAVITFTLNDTPESIAENEQLFRFVSLATLSAAFVFQMYALSEASVEEARRLREEISTTDWTELLKGTARNYSKEKEEAKKLDNLVEQVLRLRSNFVTRRILRLYSQYAENEQPKSSELLRHQLVQLLSPEKNKNQELRLSALGNLTALFASVRDHDVLANYLRQEMWPAVRMLLLPRHDKPTYNLALAATEDIYKNADEALQAEIGNTIHTLIENAIAQNLVNERLIVMLLLCIRYCKDSNQSENLVNLLGITMSSISDHGFPEEAKGVFTLLEQEYRLKILEKIQDDTMIYEQLQFIVRQQMQLRSDRFKNADSVSPLQIISVASSKGGVGKSSIALALASCLALQQGEAHKVCLIDLDFFGPTLNYIVPRERPDLDRVYLNDFIWARYLHQNEGDDEVQATLDEIFRGRLFWRKRFEKLAAEDEQLLDQLLVDTALPGLKVVLCSLESEHQDMMLPFLSPGEQRAILTSQLDDLLRNLRREGYDYVVFDTPAELKELTLCATELSTVYGGKNVFVTTLVQPPLEGLFKMLPSGYYAQGTNYLIINKARQLERKYAENKEALLDYWSTLPRKYASVYLSNLSMALVDLLINVKECGYVPWVEYVNRLLAEPQEFDKRKFQSLVDMLGDYLSFIISV